MTAVGTAPCVDGTGTSVIDRLPAISLDGINAIAQLQTRVDRKYVLSDDQAERILDRVGQRLSALEIDGSRIFQYDSLYFDTAEFRAYRAAAAGRRRRFKVRIRQYVGADLAMLEVKTRGRRGETIKSRLDYDPECVEITNPEARRHISQCLDDDGLAEQLLPTIWTRYQRATMIDLDDRSRITLDRCVQSAPHAQGRSWRQLSSDMIIETKSGGAPTPFDRALWAEHVRPCAVSKYALGLTAYHPELPSNRWSKVIRRHRQVTDALSAVAR